MTQGRSVLVRKALERLRNPSISTIGRSGITVVRASNR